ncbi:MAG TPA: transglycosylase [Betaproteobacteria bacterium]|nr:transglycosylase [Betaproteobacteria bacterium]
MRMSWVKRLWGRTGFNWLRAAGVVIVLAVGMSGTAYADEDSDFLAAREAFRSGNSAQLALYAERLKTSVLLPYVQYWALSARLKDASADEIRDFIARNTDSVLSDRLRGDWLRLLGQNQDWQTYRNEYPLLVKTDSSLQCYAVRARLVQGETLALKDGVALWFSGNDLPAACSPLFSQLIADKLISDDDIWQRFRRALEEANPGLAKALITYLPAAQRLDARLLDRATNAPENLLDNRALALDQRGDRELALYAIGRMARKDADTAASKWEGISHRFTPAERHYLWGQLGLFAARQHLPVALDWFERATSEGMNDDLLGWKVRTALRQGNWPAAQSGIDAMSPAARNEPAWRYWLARAYKQQGKLVQANALLAPLSLEHDFYGLLAEEELGPAMGAPAINVKVSSDEVASMGRVADIQRALLLYRLDLRFDANNEWNWATRNYDDRRLLAAAELARQKNWYDRAINTANRTRQLHDFDLRFLAPYRDTAKIYAKQYGLDEAWVYGLMRQESRFVSQAKSGVGASGLMQIMPATARWIAAKLHLKNFQAASIHELDTNMQFGMYYLKTIQQGLDGSAVLATAAYNAGPGRARRWRGDSAMEGAIYAESIPFSETRDYVKKVMYNAVYYARSFGQSNTSLKARLGTIGATAGTPGCGGEDENAPACDQ